MTVALPTPPTSPSSPVHEIPRFDNAPLEQLQALQAFYANANVWVHQTRAALFELAIARGSDEAQVASSDVVTRPSPAPSDVTEPDQPQTQPQPATAEEQSARATRWTRRKNTMKLELKLDGIGARRRLRRAESRPAPSLVKPVTSSDNAAAESVVPLPGDHIAHMLQLFGQLVDSRMESCQRMERLVREAHQADLSWR
jgi:hypothetical protein